MPKSLSDLIKLLHQQKQRKKTCDDAVKEAEQDIADTERKLMVAMDEDGILETKNAIAKVTISDSVYPNVDSWDAFYEYIKANGYMHMLEKRPAVLAYREILNMGGSVPGVTPFTKRKLTFKEN